MELGKGICADCGKDRPYAKPSLKLCGVCNQKRLRAIKDARPQEQRKPQQKQGWRYQRKKTGERDLFLVIWGEREHICCNCLQELRGEPQPFMFSHIKGKGAHPELRLVKENIILMCFFCHDAYDHGTIEQFLRRKVIIQTYINDYGKQVIRKRKFDRKEDQAIWELVEREGLAHYLRLLLQNQLDERDKRLQLETGLAKQAQGHSDHNEEAHRRGDDCAGEGGATS